MAGQTRPVVSATLEWKGGLRFAGRADRAEVLLDGDGADGVSPVQALGLAVAGCMAADLVHILTRSRLPPRALRVSLDAERAPEDPRRFVRLALDFEVSGAVPADKIERALALSHAKYCSVWHSMRQDIDFTTRFTLVD